jgi:hypothetical protein
VKIRLGTFAREELQARFGDDVAAGVQMALELYARRLASGAPPAGFPNFRRRLLADPSWAELELSVDLGTRRTLKGEARRAGVTVEQLVVHAVLVYLADLDRAAGQEAELSESPAVP